MKRLLSVFVIGLSLTVAACGHFGHRHHHCCQRPSCCEPQGNMPNCKYAEEGKCPMVKPEAAAQPSPTPTPKR